MVLLDPIGGVADFKLEPGRNPLPSWILAHRISVVTHIRSSCTRPLLALHSPSDPPLDTHTLSLASLAAMPPPTSFFTQTPHTPHRKAILTKPS